MKDCYWRVQSLLAVAMLMIMIPLSSAAAQSPVLASLHQFRISNFRALNSYYQFSVNGDTEKLDEIVDSIKTASGEIKTVTDNSDGMLDKDQLTGLTTEFQKFKDLMKQNITDVRKRGYPDLRLVSEMANQAQTLSKKSAELYATALDNAKMTADSRVESARSAAVLMAQMMAKYSARSNSSVAQTFQGSESEAPLDQQAKEFDTLLAQLKDGRESGALRQSIESISSKWMFIRGSFINYNEKNVPFIIDRYSKGILDELKTAIQLLTTG